MSAVDRSAMSLSWAVKAGKVAGFSKLEPFAVAVHAWRWLLRDTLAKHSMLTDSNVSECLKLYEIPLLEAYYIAGMPI